MSAFFILKADLRSEVKMKLFLQMEILTNTVENMLGKSVASTVSTFIPKWYLFHEIYQHNLAPLSVHVILLGQDKGQRQTWPLFQLYASPWLYIRHKKNCMSLTAAKQEGICMTNKVIKRQLCRN